MDKPTEKTSGHPPISHEHVMGTPITTTAGVAVPGFLYFFRGHGPFTRRLPFPGIGPNTGVCVSICEIDRLDATGKPFIGNAAMSIGNVAPGTDANGVGPH